MSFKPVRFDRGKVERVPLASGVTATKWALLKTSSGYFTNGASGDGTVEVVALETKTDATTSNGGTWCEVLVIDDTTEFDATCATAPVQATHVGNHYDLASASTLDLTASSDDVFYIRKVMDTTNYIVRGNFNRHAIQA